MSLIKGTVFPFDVCVFFGQDIPEADFLTGRDMKMITKDWDKRGRATTYDLGNKVLICFRRWDGYTDLVGLIAHEVLHATSMVMGFSGVPFSNKKTEEVYAYYSQWLMTEIITSSAFFKASTDYER